MQIPEVSQSQANLDDWSSGSCRNTANTLLDAPRSHRFPDAKRYPMTQTSILTWSWDEGHIVGTPADFQLSGIEID